MSSAFTTHPRSNAHLVSRVPSITEPLFVLGLKAPDYP